MTVRNSHKKSKNKLGNKNESLVKIANASKNNLDLSQLKNKKMMIELTTNMLNVKSSESLTQIYHECFDDKSDSYIPEDSNPGSFGPSPSRLSPIHRKI